VQPNNELPRTRDGNAAASPLNSVLGGPRSEMHEAECGQCGTGLSSITEPRQPCPKCGSMTRKFSVALAGTLAATAGLRAKGIDPVKSGRNRVFAELRDEPSIQRSTGRRVRHQRAIDRRADRYREVVTDVESGAVLHSCDEPLSEHRGHGAAKRKQSPDDGE
jgi:hypothetical protein